jgi:tetratricopeptide (TPR) repeat protein
MTAKGKISRKELLHEPDEFMVLSGRLFSFLRTHQQQVLYTALGIFLIFVAVAVVQFVSNRNEDKASRMWAQIKRAHQTALQDKAADEALAAVESDFTELIDQYDGKQSGKLARLNYAQLCLTAGKADVALPHFKASYEAFGDDQAWRAVVLSGLAHALAQTGDHGGAAARFEELVADGAGALKAEALFQLGWLYEKTGEHEKGAKAYEKLVADYPDSGYAELVRDRIAQGQMEG